MASNRKVFNKKIVLLIEMNNFPFGFFQSHVMRMPAAYIPSRTVLHIYKLQHDNSKKKEHNAISTIISQMTKILQGSISSITRLKFKLILQMKSSFCRTFVIQL